MWLQKFCESLYGTVRAEDIISHNRLHHAHTTSLHAAYPELYDHMFRKCPYIQDRIARGEDVHTPLGPGWEDQ